MYSGSANQAAARPPGIPRPAGAEAEAHDPPERAIFVGSPESISQADNLRSIFRADAGHGTRALNADIIHATRPRLGRSISSSQALPHRRPGTFSKMHDITTSLLRRTHHDRPESREWSVFGELYSTEDQTKSSRMVSGRRSRHGTDASRLTRPPSSSGDDTVQSPVDDPFMIDSFTPSSTEEGHSSDDNMSHSGTDASDGLNETHPSPVQQTKRLVPSLGLPSLSPLHRNILKCSVAYFIASLFTFSPYLSGFIADLTNYGSGESAPSPSGHMVATVAVYFNPAKTLGAMVEADTFCMMGLLFAAFVSLSSMSMFWFFEVQRGWEWLADALVLLWIGVGMSLVAYMKVWMAKPSFNTACSMTVIILFVVVVKEGGLQTLLQVSFVILCGSSVSNVVCVLLWPQRATKNLQNTMTKTLESFSTLLNLLTETFLLEEQQHHLSRDKLQRAAASHQASFTSLKKHFAEAQSEWIFGGPRHATGSEDMRASSGEAYQDAINSLNRLGQHLNGLRSGIDLQAELIKAERDGKVVLKTRTTKRRRSKYVSSLNPSLGGKSANAENGQADMDEDEIATLQAAAAMFGNLMDDLGPPLKALSSACSKALNRLRDAVDLKGGVGSPDIKASEFQNLTDSIRRALFTFESTSNHAVLRFYRSHHLSGIQSRESISSMVEDNHVLTGLDGESVFLVYFFIFTLQEFAKEVISLVDALERLYSAERARAMNRHWWKRLFCLTRRRIPLREHHLDGTLRKRISSYFVPESRRRNPVYFPKIRPHAPNTIQTPARENLTYIGRFQQSIWALGARLKEQNIKYAFKAGMATAILASPAFFDSTRPMFVHYRGEWALISFFVVISPTIGATNFMSVHRVLGTLAGAAIAAGIWTIFPEDPYALSIFGFFFSIPCFYYIVAKPQYATSSRFVLLTYNLTCLYCYNLRQKDIDVIDIAYHRALAVTVGVVWAAIVSRYWWPTEARRALSKALGDFCLNMGWLYTRLAAFNSSMESDHSIVDATTENTPLLPSSTKTHLTDSIHDFMAMELHLQIKLIELQGLLTQTQHEPRLKGPFPVALYRSILTSLQTILDKLHSMRCVTSREEWHTTVRRDFILPVNKERREMVGNIILYFSTLAAAFRLKSPLPPYLPPAEEARLRLVDAIRKLDVVRNRDVKGSRQLLFFAYALTMKGVIHELNYLGQTLQDAFGVIGQSREDFEAIFRDPESPDNSQVV